MGRNCKTDNDLIWSDPNMDNRLMELANADQRIIVN